MKTGYTKTDILLKALDTLAIEIQSDDGVANAAVAEAAARIRELERELSTARKVISDDVKIMERYKNAISETLAESEANSHLGAVCQLIKLKRMAHDA
jgi:predicted RND superfamily exporter protein